MTTKQYPVEGMSCASCSAHVTKALRSVEGVAEANVNLATAKATVTFDPTVCTDDMLASAVEARGFKLIVPDEQTDTTQPHDDPAPTVNFRTAVGAIAIALPLLVLSLAKNLFSGQEMALFFLASWSLWKYGRLFCNSALQRLRHLTANMDTLVALSITVSYLYSCANLFFPQWFSQRGMEPCLYFDSVGVVTAFILLGRSLEARAKRRTTEAVRGLAELQPERVTVLFPNGTEVERPVAEVKKGDIVLVRPGDRIAVDGEVVWGESDVDESSLTGEPLPTAKTPGDRLLAGSLNGHGALRCKASCAAGQTVLSQIVEMVQTAQGSRVPIQKTVDRIAALFVPVIVIIAIGALAAWTAFGGNNGLAHGLVACVSVLVIACPCSLGLATPTAIIVGIGRAASRGILIKDASCLGAAERIDTVVLDKTGTLTEGKPQVVDTEYFTDDPPTVNAAILALESQSEHPIAAAIRNHLKTADGETQIEGFTAHPGGGVSGTVNGETYYIGSTAFVNEKNCNFAPAAERVVRKWTADARTVVAVAQGAEVVALFALSDRIKPSSASAIAELKKMGIRTIILTGDSEPSARAVAAQVGADDYRAAMLPTDKADFIRRLQHDHHHVAMVGDGINDSAALALADLSVAMGTGSGVAMDAAMITLLSSSLDTLPAAIRISARTVRTIRQNLFWAFFYNAVSIPIAAGVLYPVCHLMLSPMIAGAAMAMSSVSVVTNSLRIKTK